MWSVHTLCGALRARGLRKRKISETERSLEDAIAWVANDSAM
jgi:hypothetical protein